MSFRGHLNKRGNTCGAEVWIFAASPTAPRGERAHFCGFYYGTSTVFADKPR